MHRRRLHKASRQVLWIEIGDGKHKTVSSRCSTTRSQKNMLSGPEPLFLQLQQLIAMLSCVPKFSLCEYVLANQTTITGRKWTLRDIKHCVYSQSMESVRVIQPCLCSANAVIKMTTYMARTMDRSTAAKRKSELRCNMSKSIRSFQTKTYQGIIKSTHLGLGDPCGQFEARWSKSQGHVPI